MAQSAGTLRNRCGSHQRSGHGVQTLRRKERERLEIASSDRSDTRRFQHSRLKLVSASRRNQHASRVCSSIFCFRHVPAQLKNRPPEAIDAFNERLLVALQRDGSSYLSNATLGGRFALRGCVLNYRTTLRDMEILLDDLRRVGKSFPTSV